MGFGYLTVAYMIVVTLLCSGYLVRIASFVAGPRGELAAQDLPGFLLKSYNSHRRREIHNQDCPDLPGISSLFPSRGQGISHPPYGSPIMFWIIFFAISWAN